MNRATVVSVVVAAGIGVLAVGGARPALGQAGLYLWVNTTEDLPLEASQCLPGQVCTLRKAIEFAEGKQATVTACFDPRVVPNARECPPGALPLTAQDVNFDGATGRWSLAVGTPDTPGAVSFVLSRGGTIIDFSYGVSTWAGPQHNRVVLDADLGRDLSTSGPRTDVILIEGTNNTIRGLEIRGTYAIAAIIVRRGAANNTFGPGLVLAGMPEGVGITFENRETVNNKVIGSWCGLTGNGSQVEPLADDCIRFMSGAGGSIVGGPEPSDRNILVGSGKGVGVSIEGLATRDITVQGNYIGVGLDGRTAIGNEAGVRIVDGARNVVVKDNVIAGNRNNGVAVFGDSTGIRIENNRIGLGAEGVDCVANTGSGVSLQGGVADGVVSHNTIHCNSDGGIFLRDSTVQAVLMSQNSISRNQGKPIVLAEGANLGIAPPSLNPQPDGTVRGKTCPGCTVELFTDPSGEAEVFEGSIVGSDTDGTFVFQKEGFAYRALRGTSTGEGNTSALSDTVYLPREPRPTNTPFGWKTPTPKPSATPVPTEHGKPTPTATSEGLFDFAYLPWTHTGPMFVGH